MITYSILFRCDNKPEGYKTGKVIFCNKFVIDDRAIMNFAKSQIIKHGYHLRTHKTNEQIEISGYIDIKKVKETIDNQLPIIQILYYYINNMLREEKLERIINE